MMTVRGLADHLVVAFLLFISHVLTASAYAEDTSAVLASSRSDHVLDSNSVAALLQRPGCLASYVDTERSCVVESLSIPAGGITLTAELYLPSSTGTWPLVILIPGGFNETELIMQAPRYDAPRLAECGIAALVYYKRGLGLSGGVYAKATNDDFIDDVVAIANVLAAHPGIDSTKIGVMGGSGGGRIAPLVAARWSGISFVVTKSGPIVSYEDAANFNIDYALRYRGYDDSLVTAVMPLWRRHHAAWARSDTSELEAVAEEIIELRKRHDPFLLPTPYHEVFTDTNLVFLWPSFRSASHDFLSELERLRVPWLAIYGELDPIVPVEQSVSTIQTLMARSGNDEYAIIILPEVGHSFMNPNTGKQVPVLNIVVNWLKDSVL